MITLSSSVALLSIQIRASPQALDWHIPGQLGVGKPAAYSEERGKPHQTS